MKWLLVLGIINLLVLIPVPLSSVLFWLFHSLQSFLYSAFFMTITLDMRLSIKAFQMYKKIQEDTNEGIQFFKDKLNKILKQLKLLITLLVTILGNLAILVISSILSASVTTLMVEDNSFYQIFVKHVLLSNSGYLTLIVHPLVYGLYFGEIHQPLCKRFKRIVRSCKFNKMNSFSPTQASSGQSIRRTWIHMDICNY